MTCYSTETSPGPPKWNLQYSLTDISIIQNASKMKLMLLMKEWTYYILKLLRTSAFWPDEFITNFNPHQGWQIYICNTWYSFLDRLLGFLSEYSSFPHPHHVNHKLNKYPFCVICCCVFAMRVCVCLGEGLIMMETWSNLNVASRPPRPFGLLATRMDQQKRDYIYIYAYNSGVC